MNLAALARSAISAFTDRGPILRLVRPAPGLAETFELWLVAMSSSLDPGTIKTYRRTYSEVA
jgi:hypothetical protein